jgi:sialate O-acetylesterase
MRSTIVAGNIALLAGLVFAQTSARAAPLFNPLFGDHAVIQRSQPIAIRGTSAANERVEISIGQQRRTVRSDGEGRFVAHFDPVEKTGPIALSATGPSGHIESMDVVIGDVFLCSGQSNMEMEVRYAQDAVGQIGQSTDDQLRLMTIGRDVADEPRTDFAQSPHWEPAAPDSVPAFSAACYYMVRELRKSANVPIGAIASSWGGSQISPWMGERAQIATGRAEQAALVKRHARNALDAERIASAQWESWWRRQSGSQPGREPWQIDSIMNWTSVPAIGAWESWGVSALADYNGMVWFRREIDLTEQQVRKAATLSLGTLDDVGRVWLNGQPVGMSARAWRPSSFAVPPGTLRVGRNILIVNIEDGYGNGGLEGPAGVMAIHFDDGTSVALADRWQYSIAQNAPRGAPRVPWGDLAGAGTLYNGMIAPLGSIGLKGVAWYQGESDTDIPGYASRLKAMIADWRRQFDTPNLGFAIVQLAAFGKPATAPADSGWASLRAAQQNVAAADQHVGLASAVDLGDPFDIHPGEKQELGRRLARVMRSISYGEGIAASGPQVHVATAMTDGGARMAFTGLTGALVSRSGTQILGVELCAEAPDSCRFALAHVEGSHLIATGDGRPATRIRYAWADYPVVNLYDEAPLPVGPFEIAIMPKP